jgi:hypothetical protein
MAGGSQVPRARRSLCALRRRNRPSAINASDCVGKAVFVESKMCTLAVRYPRLFPQLPPLPKFRGTRIVDSADCSGANICSRSAPNCTSPHVPRVLTFIRTFFRSPTPDASYAAIAVSRGWSAQDYRHCRTTIPRLSQVISRDRYVRLGFD